jgi:opacity protein-like surface antigen
MLKNLTIIAISLSIFLQAHLLWPQIYEITEEQVKEYTNFALSLFLQEKYREAAIQLRSLEPIIKSIPDLEGRIDKLCELYFVIGSCMYFLNKQEQALEEFEKVLDYNPEYTPPNYIISSSVKTLFFGKKSLYEKSPIPKEKEMIVTQPLEEKTDSRILSFRIHGGYYGLSAGDLDMDIKSRNLYSQEWVNYYINLYGGEGEMNGEHKPIESGYGLGGDILIKLINNFRIGFGFEMLSKTENSTVDMLTSRGDGHSFYNYSRNMTQNIKLNGILFKLNYSIPLSSFLSIFLDLGVGSYSTEIKYDLYYDAERERWLNAEHETSTGLETGWFLYYRGNWNRNNDYIIKKNSIGYTAGLGVEISLTKNFSLFAAGSGRFLNLGDVEASEKWNQMSDYYYYYTREGRIYRRDTRYIESDTSWDVEGPLYTYDREPFEDEHSYSFITTNQEFWREYSDIKNFRKSQIDLNGINVIFGIIIRFF